MINKFLICHFFKESDLTFRLASGLVIWQPMWEHRQPDIPAFTALIKPVRNIVTGGEKNPYSQPYKSLLEIIYFCWFIIKTCNLPCLSQQQRGTPQSTTSAAPVDLATLVPW